MKRASVFVLLGAAACSPAPAPLEETAMELHETALEAPGFVDFLVIDGGTAWTTNEGRVERWSPQGKQAEVAIPQPCGTMALAADDLWVANCRGGDLYRVDPATAVVKATIETGIANPYGETNVVAGAGSIWVPSDAEGLISRIDPETNEVIATIKVVPGTFFLAFGLDALWAVSSDEKLLQRVDPATNSVTGTVELGNQPGFLATGEGAVWVQEQKDGTVAKILPDSLEVAARTKVGESLLYGDIDVGDGKVWLRTTDDQTFVTLDAESARILGRYGAAAGSGAIRYTPEGIWTTAHDVERISWWTVAGEE